MPAITIRVALPQDARQLAALYAPYVTETAISFECEPPTATAMLQRMDEVLLRYPYLVAVRGQEILGYAYAKAFVGRAAYAWAAETTIYLKREERGQGLGRLLYGRLEEILRAMGIQSLNACVGVPREAADEYLTYASVDFHKRLGYAWVGRFHSCGYKFGRWYDMAWLEKSIGEHPTPAPPVKFFPAIRADFGL